MNTIPDDQLIASYLSGECTDEEIKAMEQWLESNPDNRDYISKLEKAWSPRKRQPNVWNKDSLWLNIQRAAGLHESPIMGKKRIPIFLYTQQSRLIRLAAGVLLAISFSFFSYRIISDQLVHDQPYTDLIVANGTQEKLTLSDGTIVSLDAGSSFSYPAEFAAKTREVILDGEGYFEVASDESKPFIVQAGDAVIQVLGTKFSVRNWQLDRSVRVVVAEGKVGLRSTEDRLKDAVVITGGQVAVMLEGGAIQPPESVDIDKYLGWLNQDIRFDDETLAEILFHLERWYDVKFELANSAIASERLTLSTQKKSIETILEMIAVLTDLSYRRSGKTIFLSRG